MAAAELPFAEKWDVICTAGDGVQLENLGVEPVPEPATLVLWLVGLGVAGIALVRRRKRIAA